MTIGIYAIVNLESMIAYIGQSVNIEKRLDNHIWELNNLKHKNSYLLNAWKKYGMDNFAFIILEQCEQKELNELEIKWGGSIKSKVNGLWQQTYNILDCGEVLQYSIKSSEKAQRTKRYYRIAELEQRRLVLEYRFDVELYNDEYYRVSRIAYYQQIQQLEEMLKNSDLENDIILDIENELLRIRKDAEIFDNDYEDLENCYGDLENEL